MRNHLLWLRYDGALFHGWQRQQGPRTVQGELEAALDTILGRPYRLTSSSRTDAGVHALQHPVNVLCDCPIPASGLMKGLNSTLPADLSVTAALEVAADFNAKKMAVSKTYRYQVCEGRDPDPFLDRYAWRVGRPLDLDAMRHAAACLPGEHDFSAFRAADCDSKSPRRLLTALIIERTGPLVALTVSGNAFLRNMVRILAGSLVEVGTGRRGPDWLPAVLASRDRTRAGRTAPPQGLFLVGVDYPPEVFAEEH